jgi:S1-C subfamily serine protease
MKAPRSVLRQLPNLEVLLERLEEAPEPVPGPLMELAEAPERAGPPAFTRERLLEAGTRAIRRIHDEGEDVDLDPAEMFGLEAIVHVEGRPALLIQNGRFAAPPTQWQILEQSRDRIERTCRSVGRIEVDGHPSFEWIGTGFLVAEDVVMTNRHVASEFSQRGQGGRWGFIAGIRARIDYVEELGAANPAEFAITDVIGIHRKFDLALLRVERQSSQGLPSPEPLTVASQAPSNVQGRQVYAVGYPAWDGRRNDPLVMQRIFLEIFNVKRLQPGEIMQFLGQKRLFLHDCSTLGGNSGSCVVDLQTHQVIGLHFGGRYLQGNSAVALWLLTRDRLLKKAQVNFG